MTIYARNRRRMWTAFSHAGHAILNVADQSNPGRTLSILIDEDSIAALMSGNDRTTEGVVEDLYANGIRLAVPVPTPLASDHGFAIAA